MSAVQDLRFALRSLRAGPGYAVAVVFTLALAIGANAVIYSFVHVLVLRPLPLRDEERVGFVRGADPRTGNDRTLVSEADFLDLSERVRGLESLAAYRTGSHTWTGAGEPERLTAQRVTGRFFEAWGLEPVVGRLFGPAATRPGEGGVVVLSHSFWQQRFGGDSALLGTSLVLDGVSHTVVGVLGPELEIGSLSLIEVWTPLRIDPLAADRSQRTLRVCGRLADGVSIDDASAEVAAIAARLQQEHPETNAGWEARVLSARDSMIGPNARVILALLVVVVSGVLVVGCANAANLVLARASTRRRELAVRTALGAGRWRLVRQLLTESLLLSLLAGGLGLAFADAGMRLIRATSYVPVFELVRTSVPVLLFTLGLALVTPLVFSLLPALRASREDAGEALKEGSRGSGGVAGRRSRQVLVVSQLALACALLVLAVMVVRTVNALFALDPGIEPGSMLTLRLELPGERYPDASARRGYYERATAALARLPGVEAVGVVRRLPLVAGEETVRLAVDGVAPATPEDRPWAVRRVISDGALPALGVPLLQGRDLGPGDGAGAERVALVSRAFVERYWAGADPIGRRVGVLQGEDATPAHSAVVVGVTGDLLPDDPDQPPRPTLFLPLAQEDPPAAAAIVVRVPNPGTLAAAARAALREVDAELPVEAKTMARELEEQRSSDRTLSGMFAAFALIALLMSGAGLYAVVSYSVAQRSREIGIRMALGAESRSIRRMVIGEGVVLAAVSLALGLSAGFGITRSIESLLFAVSSSDPGTYLGVALVLSGVVALGSAVPAWRATRVDPIRALRVE